MVSTSAKKLINIATFISLFFHLILIFCLHCQSFLRISGFTKICNKKITSQCITFIVPEEGWFGQPKYSTHIKTFLRCTGFCLYFLPIYQPLKGVYLLNIPLYTNVFPLVPMYTPSYPREGHVKYISIVLTKTAGQQPGSGRSFYMQLMRLNTGIATTSGVGENNGLVLLAGSNL